MTRVRGRSANSSGRTQDSPSWTWDSPDETRDSRDEMRDSQPGYGPRPYDCFAFSFARARCAATAARLAQAEEQ
ncbi:hypothetical protein SAMN05443637_114124 [Pseudonocardia thermophila]|uniref:Uncharacterized protein n=1 Tax=Pseudonocardia thermophila TaxID=1848 RepID=A0A1M6WEB5_PSETH|nr:hypothetical protein SAMN05443637_114124 [Pseudonocardia thermophila]